MIWRYLIVPVTSALIGWGTNVLAIQMMFYPLEFVGKRPWLGWQGVIPASAPRMAGIAVDLMLNKLLPVRDIAQRIDARRMADSMQHRVDPVLDRLVSEIMREKAPRVWEMLPLKIKDRIQERIRADAPEAISRMVDEAKANVTEVFDLRQMMIDTLVTDKALLNEIFLTAGDKEFKFLKSSGLYFGFLFGIPSMLVWMGFELWWTLPLGGLLVGYATNWLAIQMMFQPQEPIKIGPFVWQGLFLRRQQEVAASYAKLVTDKLLTSERIADTLLRGPSSDKLFLIIERHVNRSVDAQAGMAHPYVVLGVGTSEYIRLKNKVYDRVIEELPRSVAPAHAYADEAMDIENTIRTNMQALTPAEFEGVLRPAYQQDEWKLILTGAMLGFAAGCVQLAFM